MRLEREEAQEQDLNLTPLIDMVFLLLVFFLAATTFARTEVEMDLDLPRSQAAKSDRETHLLVVNVRRDGSIRVDGREVTPDGLRQRLRAAAERNKDQSVLIRGDTSVQFGAVAMALDACLGAKLSKVSVAAEPEGTPR
ncbi:MAG: biopolymer transporter ExbD [Planctomycetota bacterium]